MQLLKLVSKTKTRYSSSSHSHDLLIFVLVSSFVVCLTYLLASVFLVHNSKPPLHLYSHDFAAAYAPTTTVEHIVFGIASNQRSWPKRKEYVKLWWNWNPPPQPQPQPQMRGCVFLESMINATAHSLPPIPICISGDTTSRFPFANRSGRLRSAIRVARVVLETVALNHSNVRWYVFGDDDTVFFPENLAKTLSKYDHRLWYYIGSGSEAYEQNRLFGFGMAFGGAGFAISCPLAKALAKVFDSCTQRYHHLYQSDSRMYSCLKELGVGLTRELGFDQFDVRGNTFGLLAAHPMTPLVSLHHIEQMDPIFPNMTRNKAMQHLVKAANIDPQRILQQTVCYDRWFSWTISVSWGYAVQVYGKYIHLPDVLPVEETFKQWKKGNNKSLADGLYTFNTREFNPDPCQRPTIFFLDRVSSSKKGIESVYKKYYENCSSVYNIIRSPWKLEEIRVSTKKLDLNYYQAPRRHCCEVLPSTSGELLNIAIRECREDELIYMHA